MAENNNVSVHKPRYYINKFNKEKKQNLNQKPNKSQWAEIIPKKDIVNRKTNQPLKVIISEATIEIFPGFDKDTLENIVEVLSRCELKITPAEVVVVEHVKCLCM